MREDLEQQEQLAALKAFWATNRKWITSILVILVVVSASTTSWNYYKESRLLKASKLLSSVEEAVEAQKIDDAILITNELSNNYSNYLQRGLAGLILSKALVFDDRQEEAELQLRKLLNIDSEVSWVARVRLAGLLLDMNKPADALEILPEKIPTIWTGIVSDRRGDVLMALGKNDEAKSAWLKALDGYGKDGAAGLAGNMIKMKLATIDALQSIDKKSGER
jgi:predicted negative regulator of RcsB-dependent stress response